MSNISVSGSLSLLSNNTPTRVGQRVLYESDIMNIAAPFIGLIIYVEETDRYFYIKSLKSNYLFGQEIKDALVDTYEPLITGGNTSKLTWIDV